MCTAITYKTKDHYFGRTLDYFISYKEKVVITPRNYLLTFRKKEALKSHYAIIGMAAVANSNFDAFDDGKHNLKLDLSDDNNEYGYPLYFDATNEKGLSMAGLNFPENADYKEPVEGKDNIAPFEFIPWVLGQCANVLEAKRLLATINLVNIHFSEKLPLSPLHWMISDRDTSIVVESVKDGLHIYDNVVGVLTNNPPFPMQLFHLNNFLHVSPKPPKNCFSSKLPLHTYSCGMGGMGLPGDWSSQSRFVRGAFVKLNSALDEEPSEDASISQFFHIMESVAQPRGCVLVEHTGCVDRQQEECAKEDCHDGDMTKNVCNREMKYEKTLYTSCCNTDKGIYYYTTYENRQISGVDMRKENLDGAKLVVYPLKTRHQLYMHNKKMEKISENA